jgi:hypothetical protein
MPVYKKKIDANQPDIVKALRDIPGVTVEVDKDDILVGRNNCTYWFEIKDPSVIKKSGGFKAGAIKPSQVELLKKWQGHYSVVWTLEQILDEIGVTNARN